MLRTVEPTNLLKNARCQFLGFIVFIFIFDVAPGSRARSGRECVDESNTFGGAVFQALESVSKCKAKSKVKDKHKMSADSGCDQRRLRNPEPQEFKRNEPGLSLHIDFERGICL